MRKSFKTLSLAGAGLVLLLSGMTPALAANNDAAVKAVIAAARKDCEGFEKGRFSMSNKAITRHELTGDQSPETVIDAGEFSCSSAASLYGGTGGSSLWVVANGKAHPFLARRWGVVSIDGQNVLMTAIHPSECGYVAGSCYRAHVYHQGRFYTPK